MSKRRKRRLPRGWRISPEQVDAWLGKAVQQLQAGDYKGVVQTCKRVLHYVPAGDGMRAEALGYLGVAYGMQQRFEAAYQVLTEALTIMPESPHWWYNRSKASLYTSRSGQALRDIERASELVGESDLAAEVAEMVNLCREVVQRDMALRGPGFTLAQLIEQQELFRQGLNLMIEEQWEMAERAFRGVIEMGGGIAIEWNNLGVSLLMQRRYDEAEAAFRRALEIDSEDKLARDNLEALPEYRSSGTLPVLRHDNPFESSPMEQTINFYPV